MTDVNWILSVEKRLAELYGQNQVLRYILENDYGKDLEEVMEDIKADMYGDEIKDENGKEEVKELGKTKPKPEKE